MITADYIVGLTDGEGCFYVNLRGRKPGKWIPKIETHFYIKLRQEEKHLLDKIKKFFGRGGVYFQKEKRKNHTPCFRFEINSQKDIQETLIPFFKKYPLQGQLKQKSFKNFCEIFNLINKKKYLTREGILQIRRLKSEMNFRARPVREIRSPGGESKQL
ncbi:MAG: hypothetical protein M1575_03985 [Patescibacteria group bacterium]|nr:hypothetical protein [Patescibacteria group bacterium]